MSVERPILAIFNDTDTDSNDLVVFNLYDVIAPFSTTQTQTAMANLLKDYPQTYVTNMVYP